MHDAINVSVASKDEMVAIRSQNKWVCASKNSADHVPRLDCSYATANKPLVSDEEAGFGGLLEVPHRFSERMTVSISGFLRHRLRYVLAVCFVVEHNFQIRNEIAHQNAIVCGVALFVKPERERRCNSDNYADREW